jgi:hypothetical protein
MLRTISNLIHERLESGRTIVRARAVVAGFIIDAWVSGRMKWVHCVWWVHYL